MKYLFAFFIAAVLAATVIAKKAERGFPIEAGTVQWNRDYEKALLESEQTGRPIFLLFQEIPGCQGCKKFGSEVLSNPLLVEAIEGEFVPVLVYNNRKGGIDESLLKQFREPAWNYQVVRFLDSKGKDLIPRRDRIWSVSGIASRAILALEKAKRSVPLYLQVLAEENKTEDHSEIAFAMSCFWTGERKLGRLEGVISTEAGWLDRREVVRVVYDKSVLSAKELSKEADRLKCAQKIFVPENENANPSSSATGLLDERYKKADRFDQKRQLSRWRSIYNVPNVTPMQLTKINAFAPEDRNKAVEWLSPRQRDALKKIE